MLIRIDDTAVCSLPSGRGLRKSLSSREDNKINEFLRHSFRQWLIKKQERT
jgi:hypothetical protein